MKDFNNEMKTSYKKAVSLNNLSVNDLSRLHKRTDIAIEKYLYAKGRYPDFQCIYELYWLIKDIRGVMPYELSRIVDRSSNKAKDAANKIGKTDRDRFIYVGESLLNKKALYIFNGDEVGIKEISEIMGISAASVRNKLVGITTNSDVSSVDFSKKKAGRKHGTNPKNNSI